MLSAFNGGFQTRVTWLVPAVASTPVTSVGHCRSPKFSLPDSPLGIGVALASGDAVTEVLLEALGEIDGEGVVLFEGVDDVMGDADSDVVGDADSDVVGDADSDVVGDADSDTGADIESETAGDGDCVITSDRALRDGSALTLAVGVTSAEVVDVTAGAGVPDTEVLTSVVAGADALVLALSLDVALALAEANGSGVIPSESGSQSSGMIKGSAVVAAIAGAMPSMVERTATHAAETSTRTPRAVTPMPASHPVFVRHDVDPMTELTL